MKSWSQTDIGRVRRQNQDAFQVRRLIREDGRKMTVAVVCDGMGGAKAGNVASTLAAGAFMQAIQTDSRQQSTEMLVRAAAEAANRMVYERSASDPDCRGMGTTLVAALVEGHQAVIANVGDSRCYLVRDNAITQITKDHSVVEDMVDRGEIDRAEAWQHPRRNYITRAMGVEAQVDCDIFARTLEPGDVLLLCTDGLSGIVNPQELLFEVLYGGLLDTAVERMVEIALERGAPDNVTAVLLAESKAEDN